MRFGSKKAKANPAEDAEKEFNAATDDVGRVIDSFAAVLENYRAAVRAIAGEGAVAQINSAILCRLAARGVIQVDIEAPASN